jgi:phage virion morphogenesis protein
MSIEINGLDAVNERLKHIYDRTGNLRPALAEVGNVLKTEIEDSFERSASPFGQKWAPLKRPKKSGKPILIESGQLVGRWNVAIGANSVKVGTNLPYAAVHQYGSKKTKGRGSNIPARPYLPIDSNNNIEPKTEKMIVDTIEEYITTLD